MTEMKTFTFNQSAEIRTLTIDNEPWFVGKDVAMALGYEKPTDAARKHVDAEDRGVSKIKTPSGEQQMVIINESGLYALILSSKLPTAKQFKHWVTSEVLPAIRKTGQYGAKSLFDDALDCITPQDIVLMRQAAGQYRLEMELVQLAQDLNAHIALEAECAKTTREVLNLYHQSRENRDEERRRIALIRGRMEQIARMLNPAK